MRADTTTVSDDVWATLQPRRSRRGYVFAALGAVAVLALCFAWWGGFLAPRLSVSLSGGMAQTDTREVTAYLSLHNEGVVAAHVTSAGGAPVDVRVPARGKANVTVHWTMTSAECETAWAGGYDAMAQDRRIPVRVDTAFGTRTLEYTVPGTGTMSAHACEPPADSS